MLTGFLVFASVATALPSTLVTGTVTAADTGAPLENIRVGLYYRIANSGSSYSEHTNASGEYSFVAPVSALATYSVSAWDITGVYDGTATPEASLNPGDIKNINFALKKDAAPPEVGLYNYSRMYLSAASAQRLTGASLPDDFSRWAILSDGSDNLEIDASDSRYFNHRYWGWNNGSGIKNVGFALDGAEWTFVTPAQATYVNWYDERPMSVDHDLPALTEGVHSVTLNATDLNGNVSQNKSHVVVVDKTPPDTTYDKGTATAKQLQLTASDALTGVLATFNRTGTIGAYTFGTTISVPSTGYKYVQFYSQDKIGNVEAVKTLKVSSPAKLTTPKPSTTSVTRARTFKVTGSVYGRVKAKGYVRVYKLQKGVYRYVSKKAFTEDAKGKYSVSLKLSPGAYRFRTAYGAYTDTWANPPVLSARSAKVTVR
jgi:hypothetical protein